MLLDTHLLFGDVNGLVADDPRDRLMTGGHGGGALVGHVVGGVRQEVVYAEVVDSVRVSCGREGDGDYVDYMDINVDHGEVGEYFSLLVPLL